MKKNINKILCFCILLMAFFGYKQFKHTIAKTAKIESNMAIFIKMLKEHKEMNKEINEMILTDEELSLTKKINKHNYTFENIPLIYGNKVDSKTLEDYRLLNLPNTKQYQIRMMCNTDEYGHRYFIDEKENKFYSIALGSYFGDVGTKYSITLSNGFQFYAIKGDEKANRDMIDGYYHKSDHSILEFIVNHDIVKERYENFTGGFQKYEKWNGSIIEIKKIIE